MVNFVPAKMSDLDDLELKEIFEHKDALMYGKMAIGSGSPALSIIGPGGNVIGLIGGIFMFPGVMEAFGLFSNEIKQHSHSFHRQSKEILDKAFESYKVHRIQIVVRADYQEGQRWASALGFVAEGIMKKYGPTGKDYILFARTS